MPKMERSIPDLLNQLEWKEEEIIKLKKQNGIMEKALERISESLTLTYTTLEASKVLSVQLLERQVIAGNALEEIRNETI